MYKGNKTAFSMELQKCKTFVLHLHNAIEVVYYFLCTFHKIAPHIYRDVLSSDGTSVGSHSVLQIHTEFKHSSC